ncbi:hypothetical protein PG994_013602 [Apiospora phragmitis]|uniref:Ankyrin n=1 Tax=Apiospora phragmitis TaxID=2905665 RepID=A0ABR1T953_9PEZI
MACLSLIVYMASNSHPRWQSEETVFRQFVHSGVLDRTILPQHSLRMEPAIRAFLEKMYKLAIIEGHREALRWLMHLGIKLSTHLPLILVLVSEYQNKSRLAQNSGILEDILSFGARPDDHDLDALEMFVIHQKTGMAQQALSDPIGTSSPGTLAEVFYAVHTGDYHLLVKLHHQGFKFNELLQRRNQPNTAAGLAVVVSGSVLEVEQFISLGFDPRRRYPWSLTALQCAVHKGQKDVARFLLALGVSVSACPPWKELTPTPHPECPKAIRAERGIKIEGRHFSMLSRAENLEMIDLLLRHKANVNEGPARYAGATALQLAAIKGYIGITKKLIDLGADVDGAGAPFRGRTALEGAAEHGRLDTVALLLEVGCHIHGEGRDQYIWAVKLARENDHLALASLLESRGTWTEKDEQNLAACQIDEEESVDDNLDEPQCWETGSTGSDGDLDSQDEDYTTQEDQSMPESPHLAVQDGVEGSTEDVLAGGSGTVDPMSSWGDWAFDDEGNFLGPL